MMPKTQTYLFTGRFQPFHNGHLSIAKTVLEHMAKEDRLVLAVVAPMDREQLADGSVDREFLVTAAEHHTPERNPWDLCTRLHALEHVRALLLRNAPGQSILVSAVPRPDLGFGHIKLWFPGSRVWVIPSGREQFDDAKATFFERQNEKIIRLPEPEVLSGRQLRQLWAHNDQQAFSMHVPDGLTKFYF